MNRMFLPIAMLAALAGCDGDSTTESAARTGEVSLDNASVGEVAEQTAAAGLAGASAFTPGEWETRVEVIDAQVFGAPPAVAEQMKKQMLTVQTSRSCMTKEQAERPSEEVFAGADRGNCRFDRYDMANGRIAAAMTCKGGGDGAAVANITVQGRFAATSFELDNRVEAAPVAGGPGMAMATRVIGKRLGDCAT